MRVSGSRPSRPASETRSAVSTLPTAADGFQLKTGGAVRRRSKPKLPPTAKGLVERGLMRLDTEEHLPRLFFTETGLAMLCAPASEGE